MSLIHVIENIRHNGDLLVKGTIYETEVTEVQHLIDEGLLAIVEGARNAAEALEIVAGQAEALAVTEEASLASQDTWGPTPDPITAPETPEAPAATDTNVPATPEAPTTPEAPAAPVVPVDPTTLIPADAPTGDNL